MFAYCHNNPVNFSDTYGLYTELFRENWFDEAIQDFGRKIGEALQDRYNEVQKAKSEADGMDFTETSGGGREIKNSFLLTDLGEIYKYCDKLKEAYPGQFMGSTEGMALEWAVHNVACYVPGLSLDRAQHVNFGSSIFDDDHGIMSTLMWASYFLIFPELCVEEYDAYRKIGK